MTDSAGTQPDAPPETRPPPGKIVRALLRALGSTAALVVIYYLLPLDHASTGAAVTMLVIGLVVLIALIVFQVRSIIASPFPGLRAIEALATSVPLFLLLFAAAYVVIATISASNFSQPITRTNALYFVVTVFATVGFGDITAKTEAARLVVTGQMIVDLIIIGLGPGSLWARSRAADSDGHKTRAPHGPTSRSADDRPDLAYDSDRGEPGLRQGLTSEASGLSPQPGLHEIQLPAAGQRRRKFPAAPRSSCLRSGRGSLSDRSGSPGLRRAPVPPQFLEGSPE